MADDADEKDQCSINGGIGGGVSFSDILERVFRRIIWFKINNVNLTKYRRNGKGFFFSAGIMLILILYGFEFVNYRTVNVAANKVLQLFRVNKMEISAYIESRIFKSKVHNKD
jgi:hypothetical protein